MSRYPQIFSDCQKEKRIAFVPFWMVGDPDMETSQEIIEKIAETADILELGFPFSDPLADGPVIQSAVNRALSAGSTIEKCFITVSEIRKKFPQKPIGLLVYLNLILQFGIENFFQTCAKIGIDSILIPELPIEEINLSTNSSAKNLRILAEENHIHLIFLVSTNTPKERRKEILKHSSGFLYVISSPSVTGEKSEISEKTLEMIQILKQETVLPLCVGFGISSPDHIQILKKNQADGAIIGSKLIHLFQESGINTMLEFCKNCQNAARN